MKIGRNLPRGRANEENQHELERMRRRDLPNSAPDASGNPWETIMHKDKHHAPFYRRRYIHFDWGYLIVLLVIAAAVILFAVLASSAQAESAAPPFTEGELHTSSPEFALYFETMTAQNGPATLAIRKSLYDEAQADSLWTTAAEDLQQLSTLTGIAVEDFQPHTVYVVDRLVNGSIERLGNRVYCRPTDIESGAYRPLLVCAALGTEDYWIGVGLTGLLSGEGADDAALRDRFAAADALDRLSLSVPYFIDDFASEDEIRLTRQTAISLCRYALENGGVSALLDGDPAALRQSWLHHIGVDRAYDDPAPVLLRQYRFRASAQYSFIAVDGYGLPPFSPSILPRRPKTATN